MARTAAVLSLVLGIASGLTGRAQAQDDGMQEEELPLDLEQGGDETDGTEREAEGGEGLAPTRPAVDAPEPGSTPEPTVDAEPADAEPADAEPADAEPADAEPDDLAGGADGDVELDEWGLPIEDEEEEPRAPPPPYGVRLGYEVLGTFVGALTMSAIGFGIGAASAGITTAERTTEDILLGAALGAGIALPFGAMLGAYVAGGETGGSGIPAGAILGSLSGAAVGVALGLGVGLGLDDLDAGALAGGITGGVLSMFGAVLGYELTSGPHPEPEDEAASATVVPTLAPLEGGVMLGAYGAF